MGKTKKLVEKIVYECDIILYVLDARFPEETLNRDLLKRLKNKKVIFVLNKCDLVKNKENLEKLKNKYKNCVYISATKRLGTLKLRKKIKNLAKNIEPVKIGVIGYPNVGKSSIINVLAGRHSAKTGNLPGVTKGVQWIRLSKDMKLLDTPGVADSKNREDLIMLGCLRLEKEKDLDLVALKLIKKYKDKIKQFYNVDGENEEEILNKIGERKKFLKTNGEIDLDRTSRKILKDFIEGRIKV
jgi:ribosome biogenesis GTPase A